MQDADENQVAYNQGDRGHGGKKDDAGFSAALVEAVQRHVEAAVTLVAGHPEQKHTNLMYVKRQRNMLN